MLLAMIVTIGNASELKKATEALEKTISLSDPEWLRSYELHKKMLGNQEVSKELRDWIEEVAFAMGDQTGIAKKLPIHKMSSHNLLNENDLTQGIITINGGRQTTTGIWLNTILLNEDEIKYVATHELAHWILQHLDKKQYPYQNEFEADELAINTLYKLNKMDIILTELINRNFIGYNYNIKEHFGSSNNKNFKILYPTEKERALYYKKIIENLPNKKTNLSKQVLQKNRNLIKKEFLKPCNVIGNIGCAAFLFYSSYYWAQEASKIDSKAKKKLLKIQLEHHRLKAKYPEYVHRNYPDMDNQKDLYNASKKLAIIESGLAGGCATFFLYPLIKTGRAAALFKKKGLI